MARTFSCLIINYRLDLAGDHFVKLAYLRATSKHMIRTSLSSPSFLMLGQYGAPLPNTTQREILAFESYIFVRIRATFYL